MGCLEWVVTSLDRMSAPDRWGYYDEHYQAMVDNDEAMHMLSRVVNLHLNTYLPAEMVPVVSATKGVALPKPAADLRPIGMGCKLRLVSTSYSNSLHSRKYKSEDPDAREIPDEAVQREWSDFFLKHQQYGISVAGGLEAMIHTIRLYTELMPHRVLIKLDLKNAFNMFKRTCGHRVLTREFPDTAKAIRPSTTFTAPMLTPYSGTPMATYSEWCYRQAHRKVMCSVVCSLQRHAQRH